MNINDPLFQWMQDPLNELTLILMRGLPASGKSYRAKELSGGDDTVIFSADHYFGLTKEEYVASWTKDKLHHAHSWCQRRVRESMQRQRPLVIVDNTNTRIAEMMPYFDMAVQYKYKVQIEEPTSPWWINDIAPYLLDKQLYKAELEAAAQLLFEKNQETHCVPLESIRKMLARYQTMVLFSDLVRGYCRRNPDETFDYLGHAKLAGN